MTTSKIRDIGLVQAMRSVGQTENGAASLATTGDPVLDFYFHAPTLVTPEQLINRTIELFLPAFRHDPVLAIQALFYVRDVREGQGRRELFRICLDWLADNAPDVFRAVLPLVPVYGRWDDALIFAGHYAVADDVTRMVRLQILKDLKSEHPSLLAKWMPRESASSVATRKLASIFREAMYGHMGRNGAAKRYREMLRSIMPRLAVVETLMSQGRWSEINLSSVPSQAMRIYRKAFRKQMGQKFTDWIAAVQSGGAKINAATVTPYEIIRTMLSKMQHDEVLEALWLGIKNFLPYDVVCVADFSGSMLYEGAAPYYMALAMALYTAQHNKGEFAGKFISFSETPELVDVSGGVTLHERAMLALNARKGYNTNIQAVFELMLSSAIRWHVAPEAMPRCICIVSDMQFDEAAGHTRPPYLGGGFAPNPQTNFERIKQMYADYGYEMPELIFWNVRSADTDTPVTRDERGVTLVAGSNPVIFEKILQGDTSPLAPKLTPMESMLQVLTGDRYAPIAAALEDKNLK